MQPSVPGPLARHLNPATRHSITVAQIETVLGLDEKFTPFARNLTEKLIELLESVNLDATVFGGLAGWLDALREVAATAPQHGSWDLAAPTARHGNPLGGHFSRYPKPSFLLEPSDFSDPVNGIALLFLAALLTGRPPTDEQAHVLRRSLAPRSSALRSIHQLPAFRGTQTCIDSLAKAIQNTNNSLRTVLRQLIEAVKEYFHPTATRSRQPRGLPRPSAPPVRHTSFGGLLTASDETAPVAGEVCELVGEPDVEGLEPPVATPILLNKDVDDTCASEEEVEARARESRLWVARHQQLVSTSTVRLTQLERRHFVRQLLASIGSASQRESLAAAILLLMYVTGRTREEVLSMTIGVGGVIRPGGVYVRNLNTPTDGYQPSDELLPSLLPTVDSLKLRLPAVLLSWTAPLSDTSPQPLSERLGIAPDTASAWVAATLHHLRDGGRYQRIRLERIGPALSVELTLTYRNPVVTYLLSGSETQAPPMLSYYVAPPVDYLASAYGTVVKKLLEA